MFKNDKRMSSQPFTLLLFCLFAICACLMMASSALAYQKIHNAREQHFETMNILSYINNKIKENDLADSIEVLVMDDIDVLKLTNVEGNIQTATYIYSMNGLLYEIYAAADVVVSLDDGRALIDCGNVTFEKSDRMVVIHYETSNHEQRSMTNYLRAGGF